MPEETRQTMPYKESREPNGISQTAGGVSGNCIAFKAPPTAVPGRDWRRYRGNPIAVPTAGMWDADSCYKPSALYDIERKCWRVWYNGRHGHDEYIGEISATGDFCDDDFE